MSKVPAHKSTKGVGNNVGKKVVGAKTVPRANSPRIISTRSKWSLATETNEDLDLPHNSNKRQKVSNKPEKVAQKANKATKQVEAMDQNSLSLISENNNATISQPVVRSTKSLIDSIKTIRKMDKLANETSRSRLKAIHPTPQPSHRLNEGMNNDSEPAMTVAQVHKESVADRVVSQPGNGSGLEIQVTVNSSEDEYEDDEGLQPSDDDTDNSSTGDSSSESSSYSEGEGSNSPSKFSNSFHAKRKRESPGSEDEFAELCDNPKFQQLLFDVLGHGSGTGNTATEKKGKSSRRKHLRKGKDNNRPPKRTPANTPDKQAKIKSPSDTTIYAPALNRRDESINPLRSRLVVPEYFQQANTNDTHSIVVDRQRHSTEAHSPRSREHADSQFRDMNDVTGPHQEEEPHRDSLVVAAEKFKVMVEQPKGNNFDFSEFKRLILMNEDDEFFHLTCHVEAALKAKIEAGEYVDLSRLLPKSRFQTISEEQCMQFVNRNSQSYWVPADSGDQRVTGIHKWEQAFRIYTAIYCKAQPHRSAEIWQYVYVINTAASTYSWENVAYYDFTFRHLMAENPERSWSKIYNQLWNLAMCEPINHAGSEYSVQGGQVSSSGHNSSKRSWCDKCCWRFNRGEKCKKWNCHFDHRCSYCGAWNHASVDCHKKKQNSRDHRSDRDNGDDRPSHERKASHKSHK